MVAHKFLLEEGEWLGEGDVSFSSSEDTLHFNTLWQVLHEKEGKIPVRHTVELVGVPEKVVNELEVSEVSPTSFTIQLTNEMVDKAMGSGLIDEKKVAWEFRGDTGFEGFEVFSLQEDGSYKVHAEYLSSEQFRTIIDGSIWRRNK